MSRRVSLSGLPPRHFCLAFFVNRLPLSTTYLSLRWWFSLYFPPLQYQSKVKMSSPAKRSTRSSQARSSPAPAAENAASEASQTPRQTRASALASSPMFYASSPANGSAANAAPSSPLRQMSNSQSTKNGAAASSPLRQQTESQSMNGGDRTPRANGLAIGGTS